MSVRENPHFLEIPMGSWRGPSLRPTVDKNKRLAVTCFIVFSTGHGNEYWEKHEKIIPNQMTLSWRRTPCSRENHSNPHLWRTVMLWHDFKEISIILDEPFVEMFSVDDHRRGSHSSALSLGISYPRTCTILNPVC